MTLSAFIVIATAMATHVDGAEKGLAAHYAFDEGKGKVLHDGSGNKNHGKIHGAKWVKCGRGYALEFDGVDDYVDCGKGPSLDMTDAVTLEVWVRPQGVPQGEPGIVGKFFESFALTSCQGHCYWYISSGGNKCFVPTALVPGSWYHIVGTFDGTAMSVYVNGDLIESHASKFPTINSGKNFLIGCIIGDPDAGDPAYRATAHFAGTIDEVRVHSRALSTQEVQRSYKEGARNKDIDTTWFDRIRLTPYFYFSKGSVLVEADLAGFLPLPEDAKVEIELAKAGAKQPIRRQGFEKIPETKRLEATFAIANLPRGNYRIEARLITPDGVQSKEATVFHYPPPPVSVPSPADKVLAPLPRPPSPVAYEFELAKGGGFAVTVRGERYTVESRCSYSYGGDNTLLASGHSQGEPAWRVKTDKADASTCKVAAEGKFYSIQRTVKLHPTRISVKDTITNNTPAAVGIIVRNQLRAPAGGVDDCFIGGHKVSGTRVCRLNPTVFLRKEGVGIGLVALDDVYIVQAKGRGDKREAAIFTDAFALDKNASYTIEWAVYLNGSGDYYDFINEIRNEESRNNVTVEGGFAFVGVGQVPSKDYSQLRGLKYLSVGCLSHIPDNPKICLEGIEFMEYPKMRAALRKQFAAIRDVDPGLKTMFHVAHSLYATNKPREKFPDSMVINSASKQPDYPTNYTAFGQENWDAGWRWWIFYPTLDNSFGKALLRSVDVMVDELGCRAAFMDGFMLAYKGEYTYDRWDGHSADIDPKTKTISRKKGSVLLLCQDVLAAFAREMNARGATVIANGAVVTRTIARVPMIYNQECHAGPDVHLCPTSISLGNPRSIKNELDVYRDVRDKLKWGNLYFYYGERDITHRSVPAEMYPITFEEIHSGYVKGRERLITMHSGLYGWRGDSDLHLGYLYDGRGVLIPNEFLTTVDASGVRTQVELAENQTAVLKRIRVSINAPNPVNVVCRQYDDKGIKLVLNGTGRVHIAVKDGDFPIKPNSSYVIDGVVVKKVSSDARRALSFPLALRGRQQVEIAAASR